MPAAPARTVTPEQMDDPGLDPDAHRRALAGLARLNAVSRPLAGLPEVVRLAVERHRRTVRVLDVACGDGGGLIRLGRWADRAGVSVELCGCDKSRVALDAAHDAAEEADVRAEWVRCDVLSDPLPAGFDVVTSSLFLHHLPDADALAFLCKLRDAATTAVVVNDLMRGRLNTALVWLGSRLLTRSPVVHFDAPASVRSAFTPAELRELAKAAGLDGATVRPVVPCRMRLTWVRP
jgi:2-polyprenyl-3-methyl-5-hydroxy-6-metoxy-1,4-benzoquinol methylase